MPKNLKPHLALTCVAILYGINYSIAKDVLNQGFLTPNAFILIRVFISVILFFIFHAIFVREKMEVKDIAYCAMLSIFGVAINMLCFFEGLKHTTPIHASLFMVLTPIFVLVISAFIIKEKITKNKIAGILIGLIGAFILVTSSKNESTSNVTVYGDAMIIINAISYAIYIVLAKKMLKKYNAVTVIKWVFFFGSFIIFPFGITDIANTNWTSFTNDIWIAIAFVVIGVTFFTYLLNAYALSKVLPSTVGFYVYFQPLIASSFAIFWGADTLDTIKVFCASLLFLGVYLTTKKSNFNRKDEGLSNNLKI